jgi:TolB protein
MQERHEAGGQSMGADLTGKVVFSSGKSADYDIWTLDLDAGELTQLTFGETWNDKPRWSPDGRFVIFVSNLIGTPNIYRLDVSSLESIALIENGKWNDFPSFSPDGRRILYISNEAGNNDVWSADADGAGRHRLTTHEGNDNFAAWMPNGNAIVWSSDRGGHSDIWRMDLHTGDKRQLSHGDGMDVQPMPSPDGKLIAFASNRQSKPNKSKDIWRDRDFDIWMMRADGSDPVRLTSNQGPDSCVSWSPDGRKLIYTSAKAGASGERLRIMEIGDLVEAYEGGSKRDVERAAKRASSKQLKMDRVPLEREIGERIDKYSFLASILPDSLLKLLHGTMYFGWERHPHWIASPALPEQNLAPAGVSTAHS